MGESEPTNGVDRRRVSQTLPAAFSRTDIRRHRPPFLDDGFLVDLFSQFDTETSERSIEKDGPLDQTARIFIREARRGGLEERDATAFQTAIYEPEMRTLFDVLGVVPYFRNQVFGMGLCLPQYRHLLQHAAEYTEKRQDSKQEVPTMILENAAQILNYRNHPALLDMAGDEFGSVIFPFAINFLQLGEAHKLDIVLEARERDTEPEETFTILETLVRMPHLNREQYTQAMNAPTEVEEAFRESVEAHQSVNIPGKPRPPMTDLVQRMNDYNVVGEQSYIPLLLFFELYDHHTGAVFEENILKPLDGGTKMPIHKGRNLLKYIVGRSWRKMRGIYTDQELQDIYRGIGVKIDDKPQELNILDSQGINAEFFKKY